jgi:ATP-dependent phosphofructokinase / diphosphate-dependent phosphofructokinase
VRIGVLTGGGDAPGLNAAIRAVGRSAVSNGDNVLGVRNGWAGMIGDDLYELNRSDFSGILPVGGTLLGTSRVNPMKIDGGRSRVLETIEHNALDALVTIGGDDTLSVAAWLAENDAHVVGVPKTMDNDLNETEYCIGFDSAVNVVAESLDRLHTTAASHHRVMVVEVMGRDTGWVALMGGLAGGADLIIIPEFPLSLEEIIAHVDRRQRSGSNFSIVVIAEGANIEGTEVVDQAPRDAFGHVLLARRGVGERLAATIEEKTGHETRTTVLGHLQRGGSPSAYDRIWATRVGAAAYDLVRDQKWGHMPVVKCGDVAVAPIANVASPQRRVSQDLYDLCRRFY